MHRRRSPPLPTRSGPHRSGLPPGNRNRPCPAPEQLRPKMILPILLQLPAGRGMLLRPFPSPAARQRTYLLLGAGLILLAVFKQGEGLPDYQGFCREHRGRHGATLEIKEPAFFAIRWVADRFPRAAGPRRPAPLRPAGHHQSSRGHPPAHRPVVPGAGRQSQQLTLHDLIQVRRRRLGAPAALHPAARGAQPAPLSCRRPSPRCCFTTRPS